MDRGRQGLKESYYWGSKWNKETVARNGLWQVYRGGMICSPPLLLFLSCRSSPPDSFSGTGGRQLGCRFYSIWHLPRGFLNLMHSGLHISQGHVFLCLLGPSQLLWPAIMFCPKELCRCWAQVAHRQMCPGIPRGAFLIWFCNHTSQEGLPYTPCFSCGFFLTIYWNSGTRTYLCSCCE